MRYVITGSLGHIGKPLTSRLVSDGHSVTVVSHDPAKKEAIETLGAAAAIGTVENTGFLTDVFQGADAVFTLVPPDYNGDEWKGHIEAVGNHYVEAIKASGVKHVVNLSSIGVHMINGCGPVSGLARVELAMDEMAGVNVRHIRAGYFHTNFLNAIGQIKYSGILTGNYGADTPMVLVHPLDIADVAARSLQDETFLGRGSSYIASDEKTPAEVVALIGQAIGKADLQWVERTDDEEYEELVGIGMSEEIARNYTEMGAALRSGEMTADYFAHRPVMAGWRKFERFLPDFVAAYNAY